jgi:hypothetical protein
MPEGGQFSAMFIPSMSVLLAGFAENSEIFTFAI